MAELTSALEAILFASGESIPTARLSLVLGTDEEEILRCAAALAEEYEQNGRGIRLLRLDDRLQLCSAPEYAPYVAKALEQRKPAQLSQSALETLAITAYFQPVTRAYIEQMRGADSSYTVAMLTERGLIAPCGRLEAPGRPVLFGTTEQFLRVMGLSSLQELPPLPNVATGEGIEALQEAIEAASGKDSQLSIEEME